MNETLTRMDKRRRRNVPAFLPPLLDALQFQDSSTRGLKQMDTAGWEELLSFADRAHFTLLLSDLPSGVAPAWVASRVRTNVLDNTERMKAIRETYGAISQALEQASLEHMVIKGFTQYPEFAKDANHRMQSDIDIFLPAGSVLAARDVILAMGYQEQSLPPNVAVDHIPTLVRKTNWQWRGNFHDPEMPPSIELHFCLWNEESARFSIKECDSFWDRRITRNVNGFTFVGLHPVDHLAFLAFHILRGLLRTDWILHHVYELAYFLHTHAHDRAFWQSRQELHSESTRSLQAVAFSLAETWFRCEVSPEVEQDIRGLSPAIRQWLVHFSNSPLEWMFTPNHDSVWLHITLAESFGQKVRIARRTLLPNRIPSLEAARFSSSNLRRLQKTPRYSFVRYVAYVAGRSHHFSYVFSRGIWRGARWWLSQKQLGKSPGVLRPAMTQNDTTSTIL